MAGPSRIDELRKKFDENPRRYFAPLANEYRKIGDFEQAIFICQEFLPQQPGHMSGHIVYGQALFESGKHDEARSVFETALALDPENLIALRHLGDIARAHGDYETARAWYRRVLESDPRNEEIAGILTALDADTSTLQAAASAPGASVADEPLAVQSAAEAAAVENEPNPLRDPSVSEPLAAAPAESSFDDIAKLFTSPSVAPSSSTADGPLELIHEGEDILGSSDHDTKTGTSSAAAANALPGGHETFPGASDAGAGFQPAFLDGLTTAESAVPPPAAEPQQGAPPSPAPPPSSAASTPFVTETMAELYVKQGHLDQALEVYRKLVNLHPNDAALAARFREIEAKSAPPSRETATAPAAARETVVEAGPTIRDFLGSIAEFRPRSMAATNAQPHGPASPTAELPLLDVSSEPRRGGTVGGSLTNLFADAERQGRADDVRPANREVASPPPSRDVADEAPSSIRGRPSTPAANELSLDHVFRHATPASGAGKQSSFSFDQFFSQQAQQDVAASDAEPSSEANAGLSDDIQQFNAWLEGLKKT
jgi:tetratricopeptide (TPR) repeat protein